MQPRIFKRWGSSASKMEPRRGRKGKLYVVDKPPPPPTPEEEVRIIRRRHMKAERDERMDITRAITPPKTYMGGFTRPKDLRAANWFPGGEYAQRGKVYESPPKSAYEPHTVFLLETRYRVRHGVGRVDAEDHIVGVCRAVDFVQLVSKYNSKRCPAGARQSMDNACWPWIPNCGKVLKQTKWLGQDERLEDVMKDIYGVSDYEVPIHIKRSSPMLSDASILGTDYLPHVSNEPFWRPLLAITLSTRPLALSLSRLSKAKERGLAFYASIVNEDRKCLFSFGQRMRNLRLNRFHQLTGDIVSRLAGHQGGFVGIRFNMNERGRGISGEGLADPIPLSKRTVTVQVGRWYQRSEDLYNLYENSREQWDGHDALHVAFMNEWGRRLDAHGIEIPLTAEETQGDVQEIDDESEEDPFDRDEEDDEILLNPRDPGRPSRLKYKDPLRREDETGVALRKKLALRSAQRHHSVIKV